MTDLRWLADYREDGRVLFRIGRRDDELVAEWRDLVTLTAGRDGSSHRLEVAPGAPAAEVEKVRRGSVALLLRQLQGKLALHGSAVAIDGRALVFLGRSGQGKSTLAAGLCARSDAALLSDDAVALDPDADLGFYRAAPMEANHWLQGDDGAKRPIAAARVAHAPAPLAAIVDLVFADVDAPRLVALGAGVHAVAALLPQVARFIVDEPEVQRRELEAVATLVERVPTYRLERARSLERLDDCHALLRALIQTRSDSLP